MLHILLLILKIIGIILAVILGIIILLVSIVLFVPIRYEISAKCDGTIDSLKAKVKVTWFLHLLRADVFVKGKKVKWQVKAAWINKSSAMVPEGQKEAKNSEKEKQESFDEDQKVEKAAVKNEDSDGTSKIVEEKCDSHMETIKRHRLEETYERTSDGHKNNKKSSKTFSEKREKESFRDKIKKFVEKIKNSMKNICEKLKDLLQKKDKITDFLTEEAHVRAFKKVKREASILLRHLKPKKINVKLRYGFDDPCTTGQVLGGLSILYPLWGDAIEILPDFENQVLEGNGYLKGKVRISYFVSAAGKLLLCKDIRKSYKDIRNFKL